MTEISSPNNGVVEENPPKKSLISFAFHGAPVITTTKLNGNKNYLNWYASVELWFLGQHLSDHLTKKVSEINKEINDDWKVTDYQLVSFLWNSIEPNLMAHFHIYRSCYEVWKKAKKMYANNIQRMYASVCNLAIIQMNDQDLLEYLTRAHSTIDSLKLMLVSILRKLNNMFVVFILHSLCKEYSLVKASH